MVMIMMMMMIIIIIIIIIIIKYGNVGNNLNNMKIQDFKALF